MSTAEQSADMDEELRELIDNHNRRIWAAQNSEYDLNGRRVRKGHATVAVPTTKVTLFGRWLKYGQVIET